VGGLVGDPTHVADALYHAAKDNKAVYVIMQEVMKALERNGINHDEEAPKMAIVKDEKAESGDAEENINLSEVTMCSELLRHGLISNRIFNKLSDLEITDLTQLNQLGKRQFSEERGVGKLMVKVVSDLMIERDIFWRGQEA
jgi:hypothetical protein